MEGAFSDDAGDVELEPPSAVKGTGWAPPQSRANKYKAMDRFLVTQGYV